MKNKSSIQGGIENITMIGYVVLLMLSLRVSGEELQCIEVYTPDGIEHMCNDTMEFKTGTECCYNPDMSYYYCCPVAEARRDSREVTYGGILLAVLLIALSIIFLCVFCVKCPLGNMIQNHRLSGDPGEPSVDEVYFLHV